MSKEFPRPTYPHDKAQYEAACRWLGYTPLTFGKKPLPEFLYQNITCDMVEEKGAWVYDAKQAVASTIAVAEQLKFSNIPSSADFPKGAFELFLKHLYKGIFAACKDGLDQTPPYSNVVERFPSAEIVGILGDSKDNRPLLLLSLEVVAKLKELGSVDIHLIHR